MTIMVAPTLTLLLHICVGGKSNYVAATTIAYSINYVSNHDTLPCLEGREFLYLCYFNTAIHNKCHPS